MTEPTIFSSAPDFLLHPETDIERRFCRFAENNPHVLREFETRALAAHRKNPAKPIGVKQIAETIRWEVRMEVYGEEFKVNNSYTAYVARWLIWKHPKLGEVIETRARAKERTAA